VRYKTILQKLIRAEQPRSQTTEDGRPGPE